MNAFESAKKFTLILLASAFAPAAMVSLAWCATFGAFRLFDTLHSNIFQFVVFMALIGGAIGAFVKIQAEKE